MKKLALTLLLLCIWQGALKAQISSDSSNSSVVADSLQNGKGENLQKDTTTLKHLIGRWKNMPLEITLSDSTVLSGKVELSDNGVLITVKKSTGLTLTNDEKVKLEWSRIEKVRLAKIDNSTAIYWLIIGAIVTGYLGMSLR